MHRGCAATRFSEAGAAGPGRRNGIERQYLHLQVRKLPTPSCDAGHTAVFLSSQSNERERFAPSTRACIKGQPGIQVVLIRCLRVVHELQ